MKLLTTLFTILLCSCSAVVPKAIPQEKVVKARITYYTNDAKYGCRVAQPGVSRAQEGVTVAAEPAFKFGTKIRIPELRKVLGEEFIIQDRGPAVTKRKASKGKTPVFDVYVSSWKEIRWYSRIFPEYMKVFVK